LTLAGLQTANRPTLAEFNYDVGTMTGTWRFIGWTFGDQYLISLSDAVTDIEGNALDGEWTNPSQLSTINAAVSEFPSGDGYAGGDFNFVVTLLPGDANLDLVVDAADLAVLAFHYNDGELDELFSDGDFNGDGQVTLGDLSMFAVNYYVDLTAPVSLLADLDGDSKVDDADATILYDNWYGGIQNPTQAQGDLDADGDIDVDDLDLVFAQYGLELSVVS